ncbi:MAG: ABC transporter ATP-binding protein [Candidatus Limnocylindria bacterium]
MVEARRWGWRHPGRERWAIRGVDLEVRCGERVLVLGASGSGKSTLMMALAGLLDPSRGGEAEGTLRVEGIAPDRGRGRTGLVFQDPESQIILSTAGDDVAFGLENRCVPRAEIWPRVERALADVRFAHRPSHPTSALSGGERQRLALAGVLAMRPRVLLLDEPTSNLDDDGAAAFRSVLRELLAGGDTTLLLVEHRVDESLQLVDRVVVLGGEAGVVADGRPDEVFGRHATALDELGVWTPLGASATARPAPPIVDVGNRARPELVVADAVTYRHRDSQADALPAIDVTLRRGEAVAVMGPNGSGKSTLAHLLGGLRRATAGVVRAGKALAPAERELEIARWTARRLVRHIGSVFQEPGHQFVAGRVDEEMIIGPVRAGVDLREATRRAQELMDLLRLTHLAAANPHTLSGGEQRRLSVATALATRPDVLILDEPTFGLDRRAHAELCRLLGRLRDDGRAVCMATHDRLLVAAVADRVTALAPAAPAP